MNNGGRLFDEARNYGGARGGGKSEELWRAGTSDAPPFPLGKEERRLIEALRSYKWGEATVVLKNGVPVMLKGLREDVKLTDG